MMPTRPSPGVGNGRSGAPAGRPGGPGGPGGAGLGGTGLGTTVADPSAVAGSVQPGVGPGPDANGNGQVTITTAPCGVLVTPKFTG